MNTNSLIEWLEKTIGTAEREQNSLFDINSEDDGCYEDEYNFLAGRIDLAEELLEILGSNKQWTTKDS